MAPLIGFVLKFEQYQLRTNRTKKRLLEAYQNGDNVKDEAWLAVTVISCPSSEISCLYDYGQELALFNNLKQEREIAKVMKAKKC